MMQPRLSLTLDEHAQVYHPGEILAGSFSIEGVANAAVRAVELSVLWHTEGKGDEDMSVHHFERLEPENGELVDFRQPRGFTTVLPNSPLSYNGLILKICWCVRVRVFLGRGREMALDVPFQLGEVPQPELEEAPA
jgi:hypothetical protein